VNQLKNAVRDFCYLTMFLVSLTAVFWLTEHLFLFLNSCLLILLVAFITRHRREVWPILLVIFLLISIEFFIFIVLDEPMALFLVLSLFDLFIAFSIVHFHRDRSLLELCRVKSPVRQVPQVYLISLMLALSSLYSFLLGTEMVFYTLDKQIFNDVEPFFYSIYVPVKVTLKILFDLSICSLVLIPTRWKFLQKIEQRFDL
jgi:hypothetical protein